MNYYYQLITIYIEKLRGIYKLLELDQFNEGWVLKLLGRKTDTSEVERK